MKRMSSLLSSDEKNEEVKSNLIYDANLESDRNNEQPDSKDDAVYLGLIIFGSVVFALGKTYNVKIPLIHRILGKPSSVYPVWYCWYKQIKLTCSADFL